MKRGKQDTPKTLAKATEEQVNERFVLRLFVAGITPKSEGAIRSLKGICEQYLKGRYELEFVDIYQHPGALKENQVIVAPTLIKKLPLPLRRLIGDMSNKEKVIIGLDLRPKT
jgi:circadian clock protein KaiB